MYSKLKQYANGEGRLAVATIIEAPAGRKSLLGKKLAVTETESFGELLPTSLTNQVEQLARESLKGDEICLSQVTCDGGDYSIMVECYHPAARLLVLGGGHVALPLVSIGSLLQYQITVVDDRPAFANSMRFPGAEVICNDFIQALETQNIGPGTSVVIVTRGHKYDLECLEYVLKFNPGYVGMIGSRRRVKLVRQYLLDKGFPEQKVDRVYMPIGLSIGAQSPEEIAVSIAAQLVASRRGKGPVPMPKTSTLQQWQLLELMGAYVERAEPVVAATIVRTKGSTPRKAGAKMLVQPDGRCLGTIGGGCGEAAVKREALMMFDGGEPKLHQVTLDADTAAEEGMVCGGLMDVFLERLA